MPALDEAWATEFLAAQLGGRRQARRDELVDVLEPGLGFVAERDGRPAGILAYRLEPDAVELAALAVDPPSRRAGIRPGRGAPRGSDRGRPSADLGGDDE